MKLAATLTLVASLLASGQTMANPVPVLNFPAPAFPYSIQFGDFASYSMPILDWASISTGGPGYMFNTANTIQDALVIGTGAGGNQNNQDLNLSGTVGDGFDFPNKIKQGTTADWSTAFQSTDSRSYWSVSLSALRQYLTFDGIQHDMVAYFNNNQDNQNGTAADGTPGINLWAWAKVDLVGANGTTSFYLRDLNSTSRDQFGHGDYVLSGGPATLCFNSTTQVPANIVPCDGSGGTVVSTKDFQHNLGQNDVSYAIFSDVLNDLIWSNDYTEMRVRVDFLDLNNGFENLFIGAACVGPDGCTPARVPEPGSLALIGLALIGLIGTTRIKRRH